MVSVHSISSQRRNTGYESDQSSDTAAEDDIHAFPMAPTRNLPPMWARGAQPSPMSRKLGITEIRTPAPIRTHESDDDSHSRASTLAGEEQDFEGSEKTPRAKDYEIPYYTLKTPKVHEIPRPKDNEIPYFTLKSPKVAEIPPSPVLPKKVEEHGKEKPEKQANPEKPHVPGPLEQQLSALMSKLIFMERENPTISVSPEEFQALQKRVEELEAEKKTWQKKHEALFALRDEDVENNIKIRGLLAKERREHDALKKLRDEDLQNVLIVRSKLAEATRKIDRLEKEAASNSGNRSPASGRRSVLDRRSTSMDLFAVAKTAALEQRALELEKRNGDLLAQIENLKGGSNVEDLNRVTAHKAWKDTVSDLETKLKVKEAEIVQLKSGSSTHTVSSTSALSGLDWRRMEALHEDHARYREKMGQRIQELRGEKESLMRNLHKKEDECHELEAKVDKLQRRLEIM